MYILDCTLRDGGYYNNWDFDADLVNTYLKAIAQANIDFVELGLRNFPQEGFLGPFAYTTEAYLNQLDLPVGPTYGVMVDAKTILSSSLSISDAVDALFVARDQSKVGLVRIAAHFHEVEGSQEIAKCLKAKGYVVGFNLMQAGGKPSQVIADKAKQIQAWDAVEALYFADSLGNMDAAEVERIVVALKTAWTGALGIHTHNNMGKALDNTLCANRLGVEWLDVTVSGMGRGAGNAQTENLLAVLSLTSNHYKPEPIYDLVIRYFEAMQKECGWGSSLLYFIGAQHNVHPTYVQNLLSDSRYGADEIVGAISYLSKANASSYDGAVLEKALKIDAPDSIVSGDASIANTFAGQEVLIIGNGGQLNRYQQGLSSYIQQYDPIVLSININPAIEASLIDFYVVSHNSKFLSQKKYYIDIQKPIILPKHRFTEEELQAINPNIMMHDYGLIVAEGQFSVDAAHATIPSELTAAYAIAIALAGNAKKISLVGFDGYEKNDQRQQEMIDFLMALHDKHQDANIIALTPTTYPIKKSSIYAPAF